MTYTITSTTTSRRNTACRCLFTTLAIALILAHAPLSASQVAPRHATHDKPFGTFQWLWLTCFPPHNGWNSLGADYEKKKQYHKAFQCYSAGAEQPNYPMPLINLARCYTLGQGTEINLKKAFACYEQAGDWPEALEGVAYCYEKGLGTTRDLTKAIEYYEKVRDSLEGSFRIDPLWKRHWPSHVALYQKVSQRLTECIRDKNRLEKQAEELRKFLQEQVDKQTKASADQD